LEEPVPLCEAMLTDLSGEHRPSGATGTRRFRNWRRFLAPQGDPRPSDNG